MRFPVFKALGASFAYLAGNAVDLLKALWAPALILMVVMTAIMPAYLDRTLAILALGANPDPNAALAQIGPLLQSAGVLLLAGAVLYPMMIVAALRHVVRGDAQKLPFYLGFGGDELRTLGAYVLLIVMLVIVYLVLALAIGVVGGVLTLVSPALGGVGVLVAMVGGLGALMWFLMRLSVTFPAVVATRTLGLAQSWRATKGNSARLLGFWFLVCAVMLVFSAFYAGMFMGDFLPVYAELFEAGADEAAQMEANRKLIALQRGYYDLENAKFWPFAIGTYLYTIVGLALLNVAAGIAWRYLTDAAGPQAGQARAALAA